MQFPHRAAEALTLLLLQSSAANAAVIPGNLASRDFEDPARWLLDTIRSIQIQSSDGAPNITFNGPYTTPDQSNDADSRAAGVELKKKNFDYGPPVGGGPSYPTGLLGFAKTTEDLAFIQVEVTPELVAAGTDDANAVAQSGKYNGLEHLEDYIELYDNNWKNSLPNGPNMGVLTNYTQDLFFSMERLSNSPYKVRRLNPSSESLPFQIDDSSARKISGSTLSSLFQSGSLFYTDYRDQKDLPKSPQFAAACDTYYYIDSKSGKFLPLAIRTNYGSNLIYTPLDTKDDWFLAKVMVNVNDFWFAQWNHLAQTHQVSQIAYMAAIRGLSEQHPVQGILNRIMYQAFAIQPIAKAILFSPETTVDQLFPFTGQAAQDYTTSRYLNQAVGGFKAGYFQNDLQARGLINCPYGPALKHFPFYEDALNIWTAQQTFFKSFVASYYSSDSAVANDNEIQAWVQEAQGPAGVIDFPSIKSKSDLVDVLTNMAHLVSTAHHTSNTNELLDISSTLPLNPPALFKEVPTSKGIANAADYLPKLDKVITQFSLGAVFARPKLAHSDRTLVHQFDDQNMLGRMNSQTTAAAAKFKSDMQALSGQVGSRTFGADGLSQGMPFVWHALDPDVAPYSITT